MLERIGISFDVRPAHIDETPRGGEPPLSFIRRLAFEKAAAVRTLIEADAERTRNATAFVLGADTAVIVNDTVFGKPMNNAEAHAMLAQLSGRMHTVATAYAIVAARETASAIERTVVSEVTFRKMRDDEIAAYVATGEPLGKAGAYAIQGAAAVFVKSVSGSVTNVVGLPLAEVEEDLAACGAIDWPVCLKKKGRAS